MGTFVIKPTPDVDFYVGWSSFIDEPVWWGTEVEAAGYIEEDAPGRSAAILARADEHGTSDRTVRAGGWKDPSLAYGERGLLPRRCLVAACEALSRDDEPAVWAMLEPLCD